MPLDLRTNPRGYSGVDIIDSFSVEIGLVRTEQQIKTRRYVPTHRVHNEKNILIYIS